jgi:predicted CoA-binding protein
MTDRSDYDSELLEVFGSAKTIAVVGIKDRESEDAYRVPQYMQANGCLIIAVNPTIESALGEKSYKTLNEVKCPIDLVNLFRAPDHIPEHVEEILTLDTLPKTVWMQLGIYHGPAASTLRAAGVTVIQDRCIMVEHRRLTGSPKL